MAITTSLDANGEGILVLPDQGDAVSGDKRVFQLFYRDNGDPFGIGMSNGLRVEYCD